MVGDSAEIGLDDVTLAVAGGDLAAFERAYARLETEGVARSLLHPARRHTSGLYRQ